MNKSFKQFFIITGVMACLSIPAQGKGLFNVKKFTQSPSQTSFKQLSTLKNKITVPTYKIQQQKTAQVSIFKRPFSYNYSSFFNSAWHNFNTKKNALFGWFGAALGFAAATTIATAHAEETEKPEEIVELDKVIETIEKDRQTSDSLTKEDEINNAINLINACKKCQDYNLTEKQNLYCQLAAIKEKKDNCHASIRNIYLSHEAILERRMALMFLVLNMKNCIIPLEKKEAKLIKQIEEYNQKDKNK